MQEPRFTPFTISKQGSVDVVETYVERESAEVVALCINTKSKYPVLYGFGGNSVMLSLEGNDDTTTIELPEYDGWTIWSVQGGRYCARLCLIKEH
jgi:hypothetical protein